MTAAEPPTGFLLPGAQDDIRLDIRETVDPDHFGFEAHPATGARSEVWQVEGDVVRTERGLKVSRIEVSADPSGSVEITGTLMRQIPIGTLLDYVRAHISANLTNELPGTPSAAQSVPAGRTPLTDDFLRDVALSYLRETAPGQPRGATRRMAEAYGRPEETIRTWIGRARRAGWLGPSAKGRAGAEPGSKLSEWQLNEIKRQHPGLVSHVGVNADGSTADLSTSDPE
ncbi:hypothetical protein AQI95_21125 [Streptomyces yokosukanensis]|uniref:Uncharacterized protein n=1 Tax=Streptomyces yokosukanensis TaxID=67386 RepID=A0A117Q1R3_9ACTN|nr:hypothetical protein [Streptomyces yokosukanensis]KUN03944.1 hypothetical protein AQI95_21125 [Streptomyces yokosukanensis]